MKSAILAGLAGVCLTASTLSGFMVEEKAESIELAAKPTPPPFHVQILPLAELIGSGEGGWDSVNRGRAGDTPRGIKSITGRSFEQMTVGEVIQLQKRKIFAVGRYQMIPGTFRLAVQKSKTPHTELLTKELQTKLFATLLEYKRPRIAMYLKGKSANLETALDDLAREWACVSWRDGYSYYHGLAGNRASVSRHKAGEVMKTIRYNIVSG